ncbi:MAG TPA: lysylphosphatidylglycerol synthase domain-containing protein [Thermoanaerobaculia bacterium]|nr:lysylphosphatidylglycerol synthase domain-containing protein [Thermoanaerobaculia bacterium]
MKLQRIALAAGALLFFWLLQRIGLAAIARSFGDVGWGFALVLALESVVVIFTTLAWRQTIQPGRRPPFLSLAAMRIAGDGVNALAPAAVVGGELVKVGLLSRSLPAAEATGSVGLAATAQFLAQVLFVGIGALFVRGGALQPRLRFLGTALLAFVAIFCAVLWTAARRRSRKDGAPRWLGRWPFLRDLGGQVFGALRERPGSLALSVLVFLAGWSVSVAEVALTLALLGAPVPFATAFSIAVLAVLVEGALFFVPARVGVQEGGLYAIFLALGLDPVHGFTVGLVRRLREVAWGLAGFVILGLLRRSGEVRAAPDAVRG